MIKLEIKGVTLDGSIFDNEHWRCPKCGRLCSPQVDINLESKRWYLEQLVEFEVQREPIKCTCLGCGNIDNVVLMRATVFGYER